LEGEPVNGDLVNPMKNIKDNSQLAGLISELKKANKGIWKRAAHELSRPRKERIEVNLSKLSLYAGNGVTLLVPGKVLGMGTAVKSLSVAAFSFSSSARKLIEASGGKAISLSDLHKSNPQGKDVVIIV